jgi:chromosome segregation ATPase
MATQYDATEFVDTDFQMRQSSQSTTSALTGAMQRAPTREEVDLKVADAQQKLADLKRAQDELERERSALEELRRRQGEFQTGRQEMIHNLTRGLGLLEEAEFNARRDAEQMAKSVADMREALGKIEAVHEETWTKENFNVELTRALTAIENARMEWNSARLKFPALTGQANDPAVEPKGQLLEASLATRSFGELCKLGLALTWPLAIVAIMALAAFVFVLLNR